jgi:hypothetical protein
MSHASLSRVEALLLAAVEGTAATIMLDDKPLTQAHFDKLSLAVSKNETITLISLVETKMNDMQLASLAAALSTHKSPITTLNIEYCDVGDEGARALASTLKSHPTLKQVFLAGNHITDAGAEALCAAFKANSSLAKIDVDMNDVNAKLVKEMAKR